jgi:RND family efflux transporter MFP subunit
MNWKKIIAIAAGLALIALVIFKLKSNKEITQNKVYQYDKEQVLPVQADTIRLKNLLAELSFSGTFEPNKESKVSAETQGKINDVLVDVGSIVRKGQALIQLDNSLLKLQLQAIEVQIEGLEADVNRYTILAKADAIQGVQLEKTELGLKSAKVQKATLVEQISKTTIKAPFDGVITAKFNDEGAFAAPGIPLLQLTDITRLKFTVNVSENDLSQFTLNQSYAISADAYPGILLHGKAILTGSKANMGSSFPVQFLADNTADLKIKSGMFGKVQQKNEAQEKGIVITSSAIVGTENQPKVYVIQNGKAVLQNVTISKRVQNNVVVASGLKAGDVLVTSGFINLFDGANVLILN